MNNQEWKDAFGKVPDAFEAKVRQTVIKQEARMPAAAKPRMALVMAAVLVLLMGTALALSQLGLLETINQNLRAFLQPGAETMVRTNIEQTAKQPAHATFTIEEAVNDGHQIYAKVRVHANDDVLLMDEQAEVSWSVDWWLHPQDTEGETTFSSRAHGTGRMLVKASCTPVDAAGNAVETSMAAVSYDGEDILYTLTMPASQGEMGLQLYTYEVFSDEKTHQERQGRGEIRFTVAPDDNRAYFSAEAPVSMPRGGIAIKSVVVEQTLIATYLTTVYGADVDADDRTMLNLQDGIWVQWLDEKGEPVAEGANEQSIETTPDGDAMQVTPYRAFETVPGTLQLRLYNGMSKEDFGTATVILKPMEKEELEP